MRFRAMRDSGQFELNSFQFHKLARDHAKTPDQRAVLARLYEAERIAKRWRLAEQYEHVALLEGELEQIN